MTKQQIIQLINNTIVENTSGDITADVLKNILIGISDAMITIETAYVTFATYSQLQSYAFVAGKPIKITVTNDENKNMQYTSYNWTGTVLKWNAEVVNTFQPTI